VGYFLSTAVLCGLLCAVYARGPARRHAGTPEAKAPDALTAG
jgi:hypothetical protein